MEKEFQSFCFILVTNSYKQINCIQNNFMKLLLRESVSIDKFQWVVEHNSFNMSSLALLVHYKLFIL